MEQLPIILEPTHPDNYSIFVEDYHVGYLEVRPREVDSLGNRRYDFDDLLNGFAFVFVDKSIESVTDIIAQYYYHMVSCKHFITDNTRNSSLIANIELHQVPYSQLILPIPQWMNGATNRILFFASDEAANLVKLLS